MGTKILVCFPKESERNGEVSGMQWSTIVNSGATHNFMMETEAKHMNILWHRDTVKVKVVNPTTLLVLRVIERTSIKLQSGS